MNNKTRKRRPWFRYEEGGVGNRTVCWSEKPHDRKVLFPNRTKKEYVSPSLAKELERLDKNLDKNLYKQHDSVISSHPSRPGADVQPHVKSSASVKPLASEEPSASEKPSASEEPSANEKPSASELTEAKKDASDALKHVQSATMKQVDSLQTATKNKASGIYNQSKDKLFSMIGTSKERMKSFINNVRINLLNKTKTALQVGGRRTKRNKKRRRRRCKPKRTRKFRRR